MSALDRAKGRIAEIDEQAKRTPYERMLSDHAAKALLQGLIDLIERQALSIKRRSPRMTPTTYVGLTAPLRSHIAALLNELATTTDEDRAAALYNEWADLYDAHNSYRYFTPTEIITAVRRNYNLSTEKSTL